MGEGRLELGEHGNLMYMYEYDRSLLPGVESGAGMWRYQDLLPRPDVPTDYPLPVGGTPLRAPRELRQRLGLPGLWLKDETFGPSASNKDRATALVINRGLSVGIKAVSTASTGNAALSTAIGGAATGMAVVIFVPADCAPSKVELMVAMGAYVFRVTEGYRAAFDLSRRAAAEIQLAGPLHRGQSIDHRGEEDGLVRGLGTVRRPRAGRGGAAGWRRGDLNRRGQGLPGARRLRSTGAGAQNRGGTGAGLCAAGGAVARHSGTGPVAGYGRRRHRGAGAGGGTGPSTRYATPPATSSRSATPRSWTRSSCLPTRRGSRPSRLEPPPSRGCGCRRDRSGPP